MNNDELIIDDFDGLMSESLPLIPVDLFPSTDDMILLNNKIDQLTVDVNTQSLRIELEKLKRQKLGDTVRRLKSDLLSLRQTVEQIQAENKIIREQLSALSNTFFSEMACMSVRVHCCLRRFHQVLITIVPYIIMPVETHHEASQLIYELLRAAQLLRPNAPVEEHV